MNKAGQKEQTHEEQLRDTAAEPFYAEIRQDADRASEKVAAMLRCLGEYLFDPELNVNFIKRKTKTRDNSVTITFHLEMGRTPKNYLTDCRMGVAVPQVNGFEHIGAWCLFHSPVVGSREGRIVLAAHRGVTDAEHGCRYTVKVYHSEKVQDAGALQQQVAKEESPS